MYSKYLFFAKKVKNIVQKKQVVGDEYKSIREIERVFYEDFSINFSVYDENGIEVLCENNQKTLEDKELEFYFVNNDLTYFGEVEYKKTFKSIYVAPLFIKGEKRYIILYYGDKVYLEKMSEVILELTTTLINMYMEKINEVFEKFSEDELIVVKRAVSTLSYAEFEALVYVLHSFKGDEAIIKINEMAKINKITRSSVVSGLKKLVSAGVLESHSKGNMGTYIKILNKNIKKSIR